MTPQEMVALLSGRFYEDFAFQVARQVLAADAFDLLYVTATSPHVDLPREVRHKMLFRSAYVLETIYFDVPQLFAPYLQRFCCCDFLACRDESTKRHFAKIMAHVLDDFDPGDEALESIAELTAEWAVEPRTKVAVRMWSVEVLKRCRRRVGWVAESWDDLLETLAQGATPGIECRLRKSWRRG